MATKYNQQNSMGSPIEDQQEKLLEDSLAIIKVQSFHMKCCLDKGKLLEALKHASNMLSELRTSLMTPKAYYELYMAITDQLRHLEVYLMEEFQKENRTLELYELVQYAGNIIPRLYMLICVGLVYMKISPNCRKEILRDLVEMCRGVQHPLRGLFLRNYLLQMCRHVLPDSLPANVDTLPIRTVGSLVDGEGNGEKQTDFVGTTVGQTHTATGELKPGDVGTVMDSIEFVLTNFAEMNKLWVRMQHLGHTRDKDRREKERMELRLLVGTNLVRLSQLESVDLSVYSRIVLPGILEQVVSCKDAIAQEYLMESLIQVFPDEFHLSTLNPFLNSCAQLADEVKVKNIIIALVDRLASSHDIALPDDLFEVFSRQIGKIIASKERIPIEDIITMQGSLVNFSLKKIQKEDERIASIDAVLGSTAKAIGDIDLPPIKLRTNIGKEMFRFLKLPFNLTNSAMQSLDPGSSPASGNEFSFIKMCLKLTNFKEVVKSVTDIDLHKQIILILVNATLDNYAEDNLRPVDRLSLQEIEIFLTELAAPLINGTKTVLFNGEQKAVQSSDDFDDQDEDYIDEQLLLARFVHFVLLPQCIQTDSDEDSEGKVDDTVQLLDTSFLILSSIKKIFATGGPSIFYTFPSIVFEALHLSLRYSALSSQDEKWEKKCSKIYQFVNQIIVALMKECTCAELCLKLFLEAALNAAKSGIQDRESVSYEFISQAFAIYEEEISGSKEQIFSLLQIINTIKNVRFESQDNFVPLRNQCCLNCGKLVKKADQCRAILSACALFVQPPEGDSSEVGSLEPEIIKCLRKCIKISSSVLDANLQLQLYVEIISHLTLYVKYANRDLNDLIVQLAEQIKQRREETPIPDLVQVQYTNSLAFFKSNGIDITQ